MNANPSTPAKDDAAAWHLQGRALVAQGDKQAAVTAFNHALKLKPDFAEACFDLATTLEEIGPVPLALRMYEYLLKIAPNHQQGATRLRHLQRAMQRAGEWFERGNALYEQGRMEQAEAAYRKSIEILPKHPDALGNLGVVLAARWKLNEAHEVISEALRLNPNYFQALNTLGGIYHSSGRYEQAASAYRQAIALKPDHFPARMNLGHALWKMKDAAGAIASYESALALQPQHVGLLSELLYLLYFLCRWDRVAEVEAQWIHALTTSGQTANPFLVGLYAPPQIQLINARKWSAARHADGRPYDAKHPLPADTRENGKLRIGYLSSDFGQHATAHLISQLFEQHDRTRFEIYAYSCGADDKSTERARIARSVDVVRDFGIGDSTVASAQIEQDGIDILVDLKGYTQENRLDIMALRPAPLAMHYLGYPGTTGACFIDYFLADPITAPAGEDALFSESLIRLPYSYQINDRKRPLPERSGSRQSRGLPEQGMVFCVFNNSYKITPPVFAAWMRLLKAVDGSVLWIWVQYEEALANLKREAKKHGIDPARIIAASTMPLAEHLARYPHGDLFLDTFPVCGHTTASDALWCGVPVVTMAGESFASRVAASLLNAVELPELVTTSLADYEALALSLSKDPGRLQKLRQHLTQGRLQFPLFDSMVTTRALEAAYEHAARLHREGKAPGPFSIAPDLQILS